MITPAQWNDYLDQLRTPFTKICRLRFLNPDGTTAFAVGSENAGIYASDGTMGAFIAEGSLSVNLQNGQRRSVDVTLAGLDDEFDYNINHIWFGSQIALDEGLYLSDGTPFWLQQGIFVPVSPTEELKPEGRVMKYSLVDKAANLDGTLGGVFDGSYQAEIGDDIYTQISAILQEDMGNGKPYDNVSPIFTDYYQNRTETLPDGTVVPMTEISSPVLTNEGATRWEAITTLTGLVNAWVGYDSSGALRVDPSQDDIDDSEKPVLWQFSMDEAQLMGLTYSIKNEDVYNDVIVLGEQISDYRQANGRAENLDPGSATNINVIGRKTLFISGSGYETDTQCQDFAGWKMKRVSILQKAVSISCTQILHLEENTLVSIVRTDKPGSPVEKHLVQGFTRPLVGTGSMTINAMSVNDYATPTISSWT